MTYDLNRLNTQDFETLVQSICKEIIGVGCTSFGKGPDGGREATFEGVAPYPSSSEQWKGYWVIQAKYKTELSDNLDKDFAWLKAQLIGDLNNLSTRIEPVRHPDNLLLFTNVRLSSVAKTGTQDRSKQLCTELEIKYQINNIKIISYDDIHDYLNIYRDIATSFGPFILPGDVLFAMLERLNEKDKRNSVVKEAIHRFLEFEFLEDLQSKLDQAGKLTPEKVMLEKVFIDLLVTRERSTTNAFNFVDAIVKKGNGILKWQEGPSSGRYVLKAGPGQGKSTLTQYLSQIYRAYFLRTFDDIHTLAPEVNLFITDFNKEIHVEPKWPRLPFKIILKEYAAWLAELNKTRPEESASVVNYLRYMLRKKTGMDNLHISEVELLLQSAPCVFIFDGLDEVPVSSNRTEVLTELNLFNEVLVRRLHIDAIIIATTRPQGYSAEFDHTRYHHLNIADLDGDNCEIYITKLLQNTVDDITTRENRLLILQKALLDSQVSRIMKSPLQASIMVVLVNSGGDPPTNKFDLFKQYFNTIFNREKQRNIATILATQPKYITDIHYQLGLYLQKVSEKRTNPAANISLIEFQQIVMEYLTDKGIEEKEVTQFVEEIRQASIDRLVFISQVEDEKVGFAIRSLQEYFAANGYIHNVRDEEIKTRIAAISKNSYWSNTLLFVIGYIAQNKDYLVDSVDSNCQNLNGKDLDPEEVSLTSVCLLGSWLALDILNEGIFRDEPRIENRFSQFLAPLLTLPYIDKHKEVSRLSDKILSKWIFDPIKNSLKTVHDNFTAWHIAAALIQEGRISVEELLPFLPENKDIEFKIFKLWITKGIRSSGLISHFLASMVNYNPVGIFTLMNAPENSELFETLCKNATGESKKILWEILLVNTLIASDHQFTPTDLMITIGFWTEAFSIGSITGRDRHIWEISFIEGYHYEIAHYEPSQKSVIPQVKAFSSEVGSELGLKISDFLLHVTFENFEALNQYLDKLNPKFSAKICARLSQVDSAFQKLFAEADKVTFESFEREIQTIKDAVKINEESVGAILNNYNYRFDTILVMENLKKKIDLFKARYLPSTLPISEAIMATMVIWSSSRLRKPDFLELAEDTIFVKALENGIVYALEQRHPGFRFNFHDIINFFTNERLVYLLEQYPILENIPIQFNDLNHSIQKDPQPVIDALSRIRDIVKFQLLTQKAPSYRNFFQVILYHIKILKIIDHEAIPFEDLIQDQSNPSPFRALLLILDTDFSEKHLNAIKNILITSPEINRGREFQQCLIEVLKLAKSSDYMDDLILFLIKRFPQFYSNNPTIIDFIKSYVGNKASGVDMQISDF